MDNLALWNSVADIDPRETKAIVGKPYKGTSPKPHYLTKLATEKLGPAGKGFGWEVVAEGFQPIGEELLHWCRIHFWWRDGNEIRSFEEYGQTMALLKKRDGSFMSDEDAPKKSLTDARTKALSHIGFAANIFLGRWDDSKYVDDLKAEYREAEKPKPDPAKIEREAKADTDAQAAIMEIEACEALGSLKAVFTGLPKHIMARKDVIEAKDKRKAEIEADDLPERVKEGARMLAAG